MWTQAGHHTGTRCQTSPAQSLAWFSPGVGFAEGDVLVTLLLWNNCLCSTEHFQEKGQKSGGLVLYCIDIQAQAEKRGDTSNNKWHMLEAVGDICSNSLPPSLRQLYIASLAAIDTSFVIASRAPQALFFYLCHLCNLPFFCL